VRRLRPPCRSSTRSTSCPERYIHAHAYTCPIAWTNAHAYTYTCPQHAEQALSGGGMMSASADQQK
jgi:hypothetical protein